MPFLLIALLIALGNLYADGPGIMESMRVRSDFALTANPDAKVWKNVPGVTFENGPKGEPVPGHRTEVRSRWTGKNLYFLFVCPYEILNLKPDPDPSRETNRLWNWDVAEVFLGTNFENIRQYKEFELSPQGEWVDLDIDRAHPKPEGGWLWNSGFQVKARIDRERKIWYGEMQIPMASLGKTEPRSGDEIRANLYRIQGPPDARKYIAWQPTRAASYHVPEAFGRLRLK